MLAFVGVTVIGGLGDVLRNGRVRRGLEGATSTVLVAFGFRLATGRT